MAPHVWKNKIASEKAFKAMLPSNKETTKNQQFSSWKIYYL